MSHTLSSMGLRITKEKREGKEKEPRVLGPLDNTVITRREGTLVQQCGDGSEKFRR